MATKASAPPACPGLCCVPAARCRPSQCLLCTLLSFVQAAVSECSHGFRNHPELSARPTPSHYPGPFKAFSFPPSWNHSFNP